MGSQLSASGCRLQSPGLGGWLGAAILGLLVCAPDARGQALPPPEPSAQAGEAAAPPNDSPFAVHGSAAGADDDNPTAEPPKVTAAGGTASSDSAVETARVHGSPAARGRHEGHVARARAAVRRGEALFHAENYDGALSEFTRAYKLLAGDARQPRVLNNLAVCHERMFRYDLALRYYERYLEEAAPTEADRREVERAIRTLRSLLGTIHIESNVSAQVWVDDRRVGEAPGEVLIPAGRHVIELRAPVHATQRVEVMVGARETRRLVLELPVLSDYRGLHPAYFYAGAGATVALVVTGSILGANALSARQDAERRAGVNMRLDSFESAADRGRVQDRALAADLALGGALVAGVATCVLSILTHWGDDEERSVQDTGRPGPTVRIAGSPASVGAAVQVEGM